MRSENLVLKARFSSGPSCVSFHEKDRRDSVSVASELEGLPESAWFQLWLTWCGHLHTSSRKVDTSSAAHVRGNSGDLGWLAGHPFDCVKLQSLNKFPLPPNAKKQTKPNQQTKKLRLVASPHWMIVLVIEQ